MPKVFKQGLQGEQDLIMSNITCPICQNAGAEIRTTKQKTDAKRKVKPRAFLHCPDCGSLFSNKVSFSNRISAMLATAQANADLSEQTEISNPMPSDNQLPSQKRFFENWSTVL